MSSRWGYCGLTDDFCEKVTGAPGLGCQSHCEKINSFDNVGKTSGSYGRNIIGYYSNWSAKRKCNGVPQDVLPAVRPSDLDANSFSHIVYSFAGVDLNGKLYETDTNDKALIAELQALKKTNSNLKTMWAVGGWAFNVRRSCSHRPIALPNFCLQDPPTQEYFSINMRTSASRAKFISNIISQLKSYGFDGIDIVSSWCLFVSILTANALPLVGLGVPWYRTRWHCGRWQELPGVPQGAQGCEQVDRGQLYRAGFVLVSRYLLHAFVVSC